MYDKENDILAIHKGFASGERFRGNIVVGDLVLDMSTRDRVRGVEILGASAFLKEFGVTKRLLARLEAADFTATRKGESILLSLLLKGVKDVAAKIAVMG